MRKDEKRAKNALRRPFRAQRKRSRYMKSFLLVSGLLAAAAISVEATSETFKAHDLSDIYTQLSYIYC